jgi:hypothetical protein
MYYDCIIKKYKIILCSAFLPSSDVTSTSVSTPLTNGVGGRGTSQQTSALFGLGMRATANKNSSYPVPRFDFKTYKETHEAMAMAVDFA